VWGGILIIQTKRLKKIKGMKMTKEEATKLLEQVCAIYRGTLEEHKQLQTALEVIKNPEEPKITKMKGLESPKKTYYK